MLPIPEAGTVSKQAVKNKHMKNLLNLIVLIIFGNLMAQIAIGKPAPEGSALLDFGNGTTNGIILPATTTIQTPIANGTFTLDKTANRVRMYENNQWVNLSKTAELSAVFTNTGADTGNGVIIGANSSPATGVLVLESSRHALVLPKVANPELNVKSPYPGMICYDTVSDSIAIFDGVYWNYWK